MMRPRRTAIARSGMSALVKERVCHEPHGKTSEYQQKLSSSPAMRAATTCMLTISSRRITLDNAHSPAPATAHAYMLWSTFRVPQMRMRHTFGC